MLLLLLLLSHRVSVVHWWS